VAEGGTPQTDQQLVKSAERTVRILELLAGSPTRLTLAELHGHTEYPRSSLHALLRTLRELRWIETDAAGTAYGIGTHALLCGTAYLDRDPALPHAVHLIEELRAETGHTTHYARRDGANIVYLATRESTRFPRLLTRVGRQLPAYVTALGQALLAELTVGEVDGLLPHPLPRRTDQTIIDRAELHAELERVRGRGYAAEREQGTPGTACLAVAVGYRIPATDAISCSMPVDSATDDEFSRLQTIVRAYADRLTQSLRRQGIR
jgi:DNA-binding IclR family transcriptional regulator